MRKISRALSRKALLQADEAQSLSSSLRYLWLLRLALHVAQARDEVGKLLRAMLLREDHSDLRGANCYQISVALHRDRSREEKRERESKGARGREIERARERKRGGERGRGREREGEKDRER